MGKRKYTNKIRIWYEKSCREWVWKWELAYGSPLPHTDMESRAEFLADKFCKHLNSRARLETQSGDKN